MYIFKEKYQTVLKKITEIQKNNNNYQRQNNKDNKNLDVKSKEDYRTPEEDKEDAEGVLEILPDGFGFLRDLIIYLQKMMFMYLHHR